jgi:hypothetical protein
VEWEGYGRAACRESGGDVEAGCLCGCGCPGGMEEGWRESVNRSASACACARGGGW